MSGNGHSIFSNDRRVIALAAACAIASAILYLPVLGFGFVNWDDHLHVTDNQDLLGLGLSYLPKAFTTVTNYSYNPLTMLTYWADHLLWGLNPMGYHLGNLLIHALNAFVVVLLSYRLIAIRASFSNAPPPEWGIAAALATGVLFSLHPLRVEPVAWVSGRKDLLCTLFYLLALLAYLSYASGRARSYALVLAFFCLSLLSKNIAVTLPVVLLVLDVWPLGRMGAGMRKPLMEKLPMFLLAGAFVLIAYSAQGSAIMPVDPLTLGERAVNAIGGIGFYIERLFVPLGLAPFYPVPDTLSFGMREAMTAGACMFIAVFSFLRRGREGRAVGAAFIFYLITLLPTMGLVQVGSHLAADRYSYLPLLGPMLLVGLAWGYAFGRLRRGRIAMAAAALVVVAVMSAGTLRQMKAWKGPVTVWSREMSLYPFDPIANLKMGQALAGEGRHREAVSYYSNAIMLQPRRALNYRNRARSLRELGRTDEAMRDLEAASRLRK